MMTVAIGDSELRDARGRDAKLNLFGGSTFNVQASGIRKLSLIPTFSFGDSTGIISQVICNIQFVGCYKAISHTHGTNCACTTPAEVSRFQRANDGVDGFRIASS
jgi:hypothetical protein